MRCALLVVDLEGVAGVDSVDMLLAGGEAYQRARELLTAEVNAAVEGLCAAGFDEVRVSDSHLSGGAVSSVLERALDPRASLVMLDDWYATEVFEGADAVACLGMHGPAGSSSFAAHTVELSTRWRVGDRLVSEADVVLGLAGEAGIPVLFVAGTADACGGDVARVITWGQAPEVSTGLLRDAAGRAPVPAPPLPAGPLTLDFLLGPKVEITDPGSTRGRYDAARRAAQRGAAGLLSGLSRAPRGWLVDEVSGLLSLGFDAPAVEVDAMAERSLRAFLRDCRAEDSETVALRALTLHLVAGHAPGFFAGHGLAEERDAAFEALEGIPRTLRPGLDPDELQARVDAVYLRAITGRPFEPYTEDEVRPALNVMLALGDHIYAWLLAELVSRAGVDVRLDPGGDGEPFRGTDRRLDLYHLTHLVLLDTDYLMRHVTPRHRGYWAARLALGAPHALATGATDLCGELALGLQACGEGASPVVRRLLAELAASTDDDGRLHDRTGIAGLHPTAVATVAWAGAAERDTSSIAGLPSHP